jgi:hypothetical protein
MKPAAMPRLGDITVCFYCGHIMGFTDDLQLRELTDEEIHKVAGDPIVIKIQAARAALLKDIESS